jgi:hypothetical protein
MDKKDRQALEGYRQRSREGSAKYRKRKEGSGYVSLSRFVKLGRKEEADYYLKMLDELPEDQALAVIQIPRGEEENVSTMLGSAAFHSRMADAWPQFKVLYSRASRKT